MGAVREVDSLGVSFVMAYSNAASNKITILDLHAIKRVANLSFYTFQAMPVLSHKIPSLVVVSYTLTFLSLLKING